MLQAQTHGWKLLPVPGSVEVQQIEVDREGRVFVVTDMRELLVREPNTNIWTTTPISFNSDYMSIWLTLDRNGNHYVCANSNLTTALPASGIYRSPDGGKTWQQVLAKTNIVAIVQSPNTKLYALGKYNGKSSSLYRSTTNGTKWDSIVSVPFEITDFTVDKNEKCYFIIKSDKKDVLIYVTQSGFFKSTAPINNINVGNSFAANIILYQGAPFIQYSDETYTLRSDDSMVIQGVIGRRPINYPKPLLITPNNEILTISKNPPYSYDFRILVSSDSGTHWKEHKILPSTQSSDEIRIAVDSQGNVYTGNLSGLYFSNNNSTSWENVSFHSATIPLINECYNGNILIHDSTYMSSQESYRSQSLLSNDLGATWRQSSILPKGIMGRSATDQNGATYYFDRNYTTPDYRMFLGEPGQTDSMKFIRYFPFLPKRIQTFENIVFADRYFSSDQGITWEEINVPNTLSPLTTFQVSKDGTYYIGYAPSFYRSIDKGATWEKLSTGIRWAPISEIRANDNGTILIGTLGQGIWKTSNNGASWARWDNGVTDSIFCMEIVKNTVFVGTAKGLYSCNLGSNSWKDELLVVQKVRILSLLVHDGNIFVGTEKNGLWTNNIELNSTFQPKEESPDLLNCSFISENRVLKIHFDLKSAQHVTLALYNLLGNKIATITDNQYHTGNSMIEYSTSMLDQGLYLLRMQTPLKTTIHKVIITH